ncbi:MAG: hydrogenase iron-sulfur subunit [Thermoplasmata archaeon]
MSNFEPKIIGFLCNWCSYAGADLAGTSRIQYPSNFLPIKVMCSSRVDPSFVLKALLQGADGVLIAGCHPGDCHYQTGNLYTRRRVMMLNELLDKVGIETKRLRLEWIAASEGKKFSKVVTEFVDEIKDLGPNPLKEGHL